MTTDLEDAIMFHLVLYHPLPWHIEQDWLLEIIDAHGKEVLKCADINIANEMIELSQKYKQELCETCKRPYDKFEPNFCSSTFHCCKDCKWEISQVKGFAAYKHIEYCEDCKVLFPEAFAEFVK